MHVWFKKWGLLSLLALIATAGGANLYLRAFKHDQSGSAKALQNVVIESQIPPNLAPKYYPPAGFTWSGFAIEGLPDARYGVASPPVNPQAQVLIIADNDFPAEAYFDLTNSLLSLNVSVWIIEAPGQGGAAHYPHQKNEIDSPDFSNATRNVRGFIAQIINPTQTKPLYIIASGVGAITALDLDINDGNIRGYILFEPHLKDPQLPEGTWHRQSVPKSHWGQVGHVWQGANPDLRLRLKSERWYESANKTLNRLQGVKISSLVPLSHQAPKLMFAKKDSLSEVQGLAKSLCQQASNCQYKTISNELDLAFELTLLIQNRA